MHYECSILSFFCSWRMHLEQSKLTSMVLDMDILGQVNFYTFIF